ncbi:MAG: hypothetical protein HZB25_13400 [Candidatus Eisenbacteria bacterium]|nr:hypothetical protein [Candidatus Eisenbacteria bacterium]
MRRMALLLAIIGGFAVFALRTGFALPVYATREGYPCMQCHVDPNGGGVRNDFGFLYGKNRHLLSPPDSAYTELAFSSKVTDGFWWGTDFRLLFANEYGAERKEFLDHFFVPMQGTLYLHAQPIPQLDLVYNRDLRESREAYGLLRGVLPGGAMLKVGQFRVPLGLRFDDHTNYTKRIETLGYNYQEVDQGLEVSHVGSRTYWQAALQNGGSAKADLWTAKVGYFKSPVHLGVSGQYNPGGTSPNGDPVRRIRGALFGGVRLGEWVYVSELLVGQNRPDVGPRADTTTGVLAYSGEINRRVSRAVLVRLKYDFLDPNTKFDHAISDAEKADPALYDRRVRELHDRKDEFRSERFGIEADYQPYPFVEFKGAYRFQRYQSPDIENIHQFLLLTHFSF